MTDRATGKIRGHGMILLEHRIRPRTGFDVLHVHQPEALWMRL
jgi:hypothetical protein